MSIAIGEVIYLRVALGPRIEWMHGLVVEIDQDDILALVRPPKDYPFGEDGGVAVGGEVACKMVAVKSKLQNARRKQPPLFTGPPLPKVRDVMRGFYASEEEGGAAFVTASEPEEGSVEKEQLQEENAELKERVLRLERLAEKFSAETGSGSRGSHEGQTFVQPGRTEPMVKSSDPMTRLAEEMEQRWKQMGGG